MDVCRLGKAFKILTVYRFVTVLPFSTCKVSHSPMHEWLSKAFFTVSWAWVQCLPRTWFSRLPGIGSSLSRSTMTLVPWLSLLNISCHCAVLLLIWTSIETSGWWWCWPSLIICHQNCDCFSKCPPPNLGFSVLWWKSSTIASSSWEEVGAASG